MDFAALVTDEALCAYFEYPIPEDMVLLNKRGKPKRPFKEGPPPIAIVATPGPLDEPSAKRSMVKKMRAKKTAKTSAPRDIVVEAPAIQASPPGVPTTKVSVPGAPVTNASTLAAAGVSTTEAHVSKIS